MFKKIRRIIFFIPLLTFLLIALFFWHGLSLNPQLLPSPFINKPAPNFYLSALSQPQEKFTNKIFLGHVTLLNVFATWCESCAEEHPFLVDLANQNVRIIGLDYKDQRAAAMAYLAKYGNPYQLVLFDGTGNAAINWGVYGTPETFVIDAKGIVRYKQIGAINEMIWQQSILPIIKKYHA